MIETLYIIKTDNQNPYHNLALEQFLLENQQKNSMTLYLWQNKNTVVIGRNQNPWQECRTSLLEKEDGFLARRLSGGGAVYHDLGNLNFTFITSSQDYDVSRQLSVIQSACAACNILVEASGRNDLLADGRKFSGNAFYHHQGYAYHHGTLMVDVDKEKLGRYLSPPKAKLEAKGVASVRSRVVNLNELCSGLTCERLAQHMQNAFQEVYGMQAQILTLTPEEEEKVKRIEENISRWEYLFGTPLPFTFCCESHFPWGNIQIQIDAKNGIIRGVKVYTDAMDWTLPQTLENVLIGCRFHLSDMSRAVQDFLPQYANDISALLKSLDM